MIGHYRAGATILELSARYEVHRTTVMALLARNEVARRGRVVTPDYVTHAIALYESGKSCASIGRDIGASPETIRQTLLKAGVPLPKPGRPKVRETSGCA
jgi:hypothetical protein